MVTTVITIVFFIVVLAVGMGIGLYCINSSVEEAKQLIDEMEDD